MKRNCKHPECDRDTENGALGWCGRHYYRYRKHGSPDVLLNAPQWMTDQERFDFAGYTIDDNGCWVWDGTIGAGGYGVVKTSLGPEKAHRLSYRLHTAEIPRGRNVLHSCDNPPCVNPKHLSVGTRGDNMQDMWNRRRHPEPKRKMTEEQEVAVCEFHMANGRAAKVTREEFSISNTQLYRLLERHGYRLDK